MKIEIHLPRSTEAKCSYDPKTGVVTIEPVFPSPQAVQPYAYAKVIGNKGRERRYTLYAGGKTGRLTSQEVRDVETEFDAQPTGAQVEDGD